MSQSELDRNEDATPYKLQKARERGQVAKSPDIASAAVFTTAMMFLTWEGWRVWQEQFRLDQAILTRTARVDASPAVLWPLVEHILRSTMLLAAPFFIALVVAAIIGNLIQTGPVLSIEPVKADWERLNLVSGFQRIFSVRTLYLALRSMLKLVLLGVVAYFSLKSLLPQFYYLAGLSPLTMVRTLLDDLATLGLKLAGMLTVIAILDLAYMRRDFAKKMRMSRREIKDEIRNREGDPRIRTRMRQLRREMLKRSRALGKTRDADVLITNPTHVAVALRYVHGQMTSPQVVSKGKGFMAAAMRQIAARHRIPIVQNPGLARSLYHKLAIDQHVTPDLYAQVARIIVWVFAKRDAMKEMIKPSRQVNGVATVSSLGLAAGNSEIAG